MAIFPENPQSIREILFTPHPENEYRQMYEAKPGLSGEGWLGETNYQALFLSGSAGCGESLPDYLWQIAASKLNIADKWTEIW